MVGIGQLGHFWLTAEWLHILRLLPSCVLNATAASTKCSLDPRPWRIITMVNDGIAKHHASCRDHRYNVEQFGPQFWGVFRQAQAAAELAEAEARCASVKPQQSQQLQPARRRTGSCKHWLQPHLRELPLEAQNSCISMHCYINCIQLLCIAIIHICTYVYLYI